jgi:hypothetical protein
VKNHGLNLFTAMLRDKLRGLGLLAGGFLLLALVAYGVFLAMRDPSAGYLRGDWQWQRLPADYTTAKAQPEASWDPQIVSRCKHAVLSTVPPPQRLVSGRAVTNSSGVFYCVERPRDSETAFRCEDVVPSGLLHPPGLVKVCFATNSSVAYYCFERYHRFGPAYVFRIDRKTGSLMAKYLIPESLLFHFASAGD